MSHTRRDKGLQLWKKKGKKERKKEEIETERKREKGRKEE